MTFLKTRSGINRRFLSGAVLAFFFIQFTQVYAQELPLTQIDNNRFMNVERQENNRMEASAEQSLNNGQSINRASQRSTASEIWSTLLLGNPRQKVSKPKFAFSSRRNAYEKHRIFPSYEQSRQNLVNDSSVSKTQYPARSNASPVLIQNDSIDTQTNELFSRQNGESISENSRLEERKKLEELDTKRRIEELDRYLAVNRPPSETVRLAQPGVGESVASKEFPKTYPIRQASGETPKLLNNGIKSPMFEDILPFQNNGTVTNTPNLRSSRQALPVADLALEKRIPETLPVRPTALQISERSFLSTEIVRLPTPGNLSFPQTKSATQEATNRNANDTNSSFSGRTPTFVSPEGASKSNSIPVESKETVRQLNTDHNSRVPQSKGKFVNPRNL